MFDNSLRLSQHFHSPAISRWRLSRLLACFRRAHVFLGFNFLVESQYLLPLMIGCLVVAIAALGWGARNNYWPLILGVVASGAILIGKFELDGCRCRTSHRSLSLAFLATPTK